MNKMSIKKDDLVIVLSGKDKGKQGKILEVMPKSGKVIVEKINVVSRHTKPRKQGEEGGILQKEAPIYACKVQKVCPKSFCFFIIAFNNAYKNIFSYVIGRMNKLTVFIRISEIKSGIKLSVACFIKFRKCIFRCFIIIYVIF